jgi:hypothetical protein
MKSSYTWLSTCTRITVPMTRLSAPRTCFSLFYETSNDAADIFFLLGLERLLNSEGGELSHPPFL